MGASLHILLFLLLTLTFCSQRQALSTLVIAGSSEDHADDFFGGYILDMWCD